ncbi:MAG: phosphomannomutase/phosphoglucomutase [Alphaproteobacteria bacterium]
MKLPSASLFRAYDIRGVVGDDLEAADFLAIGHAFASLIAEQCQCRTPLIVAMRDGRDSSPGLLEAMIEGMLKAGAHVLDGGLAPTPECYFATHHLDADGSVVVTGSHNPPGHNGAKFMADGLSLYGAALLGLRTRIEEARLVHSRGVREEIRVGEEYADALKRALGPERPLDSMWIAWDCGNGAAGPVVEALTAGAMATQHLLFTTPDGNFPNHHPDPSDPENLRDLQQLIAARGADLGVAFDGDGDRLGAVDDKGRVVAPDHLLMLFADEVLKHNPGATILADVKTSDMFFARVKEKGGVPLMWKTGHALIKSKMRESGALFAGEASGHIFFADEYLGFDDGLYAAVRLIRLVHDSGKKLSQLIDDLPKLHASEEFRIPCADDKKFAVVESIAAELEKEGAEVNTLDGVRVSTKDGWWLLRASNTQAALVARAEGVTPEATEKLTGMLRSKLAAREVTF